MTSAANQQPNALLPDDPFTFFPFDDLLSTAVNGRDGRLYDPADDVAFFEAIVSSMPHFSSVYAAIDDAVQMKAEPFVLVPKDYNAGVIQVKLSVMYYAYGDDASRPTMVLDEISVHPNHRRCGLATNVLEALEAIDSLYVRAVVSDSMRELLRKRQYDEVCPGDFFMPRQTALGARHFSRLAKRAKASK